MSRPTLTAHRGLHTHATTTSPPAWRPSAPGRIATERYRAEPPTGTVRLTVTVAILAVAGVVIVAALVDVAIAEQARAWLGYRFPGLAARPNVAVAIFEHNARAILAVFGLLLIAQIAARRPGGAGKAQRLILAGGELILAGVIAVNVLVVGVGLGGYGWRMARAELPHGPVELVAYALALAVYLQGRRRALPPSHLAGVVAVSVALLALAAGLETFLNV